MKNFKFIATAILIIFVAGCAAPKAPTLTPLQIQSLQTREYEANKDIVFPSVLSVFQDLGYIVQSADKDTGLITAEGANEATKKFIPFVGVVNVASQAAATAFIEQIGRMTKVRLNIVIRKSSSSAYGQNTKQDSPILDAEIYQNAFEKIENAIFIRSG